jgi:hypothetical protein
MARVGFFQDQTTGQAARRFFNIDPNQIVPVTGQICMKRSHDLMVAGGAFEEDAKRRTLRVLLSIACEQSFKERV